MKACMGVGRDAHVKIRGEGVEDLVGAHMGVGVNDTLAAALHDVGCEGDSGGGGECALPLRPMLAGGGAPGGEILEARSTTAGCRRQLPFAEALPRRPPHHRACLLACWLAALAGPRATPGDLSYGQLWSAAN